MRVRAQQRQSARALVVRVATAAALSSPTPNPHFHPRIPTPLVLTTITTILPPHSKQGWLLMMPGNWAQSVRGVSPPGTHVSHLETTTGAAQIQIPPTPPPSKKNPEGEGPHQSFNQSIPEPAPGASQLCVIKITLPAQAPGAWVGVQTRR